MPRPGTEENVGGAVLPGARETIGPAAWFMAATFSGAVFLSAGLLLLVQPLIGKFILPWFGGGPAVWTTCLAFFQIFLFLGYLYAHLSIRYLSSRQQLLAHGVLLLAMAASLPILPVEEWKPAGTENPTWRILGLLTTCLGLPYLVLASTTPLLQAWFTRATGGTLPYRLFALSNFGSLLALLSYPVLIEPHLSRPAQIGFWSWGARIFIGLCALAAIRVSRPAPAGTVAKAQKESNHHHAKLSSLQKVRWFLLSACGVVLLLAITNKICQDVAVVPFLWVLPLSIYLISFILCFGFSQWSCRSLYLWILPPVMAVAYWSLFQGNELPIGAQTGIYTFVLFVCCMVCHGELERSKPAPEHLTMFYLAMAAGGAAGGIFAGILASGLFNAYYELHVGLWACGFLTLFAPVAANDPAASSRWTGRGRSFLVLCWYGFGLALYLQVWFDQLSAVSVTRNFFGVHSVYHYNTDLPDRHIYVLRHNSTTHGIQFADPARRRWPTAYYGENSGVGLALRFYPRPNPRRVGIVGLGIGTLACYAGPGDRFWFYEIDPEIVRLAQTRFTYLSDCRAPVNVVLGDARLVLERQPPQDLDLLVLDAFTSDAIPVHLLTREAFETYQRHLKPDGILAVHISNHHLDFAPVVFRLANHFRYDAVLIDQDEGQKANEERAIAPSTWVLLSRNQIFLQTEAIRKASTQPPVPVKNVKVWTDDENNLFEILR